MHLLLKSEFVRYLRKAIRASQLNPGTEICGLLVDTGRRLKFVQIRNVCKRPGSFAFSCTEVRRVVAAANASGREVVGTFHSHPVGLPVPGPSDVEHAGDDELMFLFDCIGHCGRLWRIRSGRAYPLRFSFLQRRRRNFKQPTALNNARASKLPAGRHRQVKEKR